MNIVELDVHIRPVIQTLGYELWGIEWLSKQRPPILRIYLDSDEGIGIEDCATVSEHLSKILDVEGGDFDGEYHLEVSSPGFPRTIFKAKQLEQCETRELELRLHRPLQGKRTYKGELISFDLQDQVIVLLSDGEILKVPYEDARKILLWL